MCSTNMCSNVLEVSDGIKASYTRRTLRLWRNW